MEISEKIYRLRTDNDLTQAQFGKIAGVSDKAVSTWELGIKEPRIKPLQKICSYFDLDINSFVDPNAHVYEKGPTPVPESGPLYPPGYDLLTPEQKEIVDRLIADLARNHQSGG